MSIIKRNKDNKKVNIIILYEDLLNRLVKKTYYVHNTSWIKEKASIYYNNMIGTIKCIYYNINDDAWELHCSFNEYYNNPILSAISFTASLTQINILIEYVYKHNSITDISYYIKSHFTYILKENLTEDNIKSLISYIMNYNKTEK